MKKIVYFKKYPFSMCQKHGCIPGSYQYYYTKVFVYQNKVPLILKENMYYTLFHGEDGGKVSWKWTTCLQR